jgi:hypothetical protein
MKSMRHSVLLLICCLAGSAQPAQAATSLYISPAGSDNNSGTIDKPLATLQAAIYRATPGTTINLRGGTYKLAQAVWFGEKNSGTDSAPILIQSYPGEKAILDGGKVATHCLLMGGNQYVTISSLECQYTSESGFVVTGSRHIKFINNTVHHTPFTGIATYSLPVQSGGQTINQRSSNILMQGNKVFLTNLKNSGANKGKSDFGSGIHAVSSDNVEMNHNSVYNNYGEGITCSDTKCKISNNYLWDNYGVQIYLNSARDSVIERNFAISYGNQDFYRSTGSGFEPAAGIQLANESTDPAIAPLNNNIIRNNIVVNSSYGFFYGNYSNNSGIKSNRGMKNTTVANNTFVNAMHILVYADADSNNSGNTFMSNIFYQTKGGYMTYLPNKSGLSFSYNLWNGGSGEVAAGPGDIYANPKLVNAGSSRPDDYKLLPDSPAKDVGITIKSVIDDFFGTQRPINGIVELGAHEST